ncbi:MAG: BlaI/MecI/CopY family transcriptional regulator [Pseudobacteriovorax sp.]|nr:BlaI/MecI/CopY family transcriptional regulator [Pseudobacteriovorax sp.]
MSRPINKNLTDHELKIMKLFWDHDRASVRDILNMLDPPPAYTSLQTAVNNLVKKNYLKKDNSEKEHRFTARIDRLSYQNSVAENLIEDVYEGKAFDLALNLIENQKLSSDEIERIRQLLGELD